MTKIIVLFSLFSSLLTFSMSLFNNTFATSLLRGFYALLFFSLASFIFLKVVEAFLKSESERKEVDIENGKESNKMVDESEKKGGHINFTTPNNEEGEFEAFSSSDFKTIYPSNEEINE